MELKIGNYASYLTIKKITDKIKPIKTKSLGNGVYLDYDKDNNLVGIEFTSEVKVSHYEDYKE